MVGSLGYRIDTENRVHLKSSAKRFRLLKAFKAPPKVDHRGWLTVEDQGPMGSCTGHARSTCAEICNWIDTHGHIVHLSRMFAYLTAQKRDNLLGADQGATIDGAVRASKEDGECLEETFPYPGRYTTQIPAGAFSEAALHKMLNHSLLRTYDDLYNWLGSGVGAVIIGMNWVSSFSDNNGLITSFTGNNYGGHAICLSGYTERQEGGRNWIIMSNSHGRDWGKDGHAEINPKTIDAVLRSRATVCVGVSDLEEYNPRDYMLL